MKEQKNTQIIIVEGKTDTQKLKNVFGEQIKTIETNGLALNEKTLEFIKRLSKKNKIIVFTDPDGPGKRIRETINNYLGGDVFNAFVSKSAIDKESKKIGIAEADDEAIKKALDNLITFNKENESISWEEYLNNDFYLKENRKKISKYWGISEEINSKTLFKWLNWMQADVDTIKNILGEYNGN
ncbi:ribonuclease M5 [[Acholeplasma] multilocale]|uniref:ribonuclease M5 n=1 Tax=[Acholeplasma] multilocale TaxID=264638 RepID=UPI00047C9033|nr:ribonuclease M5 [[Acholeplasma] multilocale]